MNNYKVHPKFADWTYRVFWDASQGKFVQQVRTPTIASYLRDASLWEFLQYLVRG